MANGAGRGVSGWLTPAAVKEALACGSGRGVRVAVLDSGVEIAHGQFGGRSLLEDRAFEGDGSEGDGEGTDLYGHGTAVAGIIWQVAPEAEIGSLRVLGPKLSARTMQIAQAAKRAVREGYHILNCSFACGLGGHLPIYKEWLDEAFIRGVHVVAASSEHAQPEWPAHFSSVLGVDSSPHSETGLGLVPGRLVEFEAKGANCRVPWKGNSYREMTGCSFAAAEVCGLLARLLSVHPDLHPAEAKSLLRRVARRAAQ